MDINECVTSPCRNGATCQNANGSYRCHCQAGYTGRNCEVDIDDCRPSEWPGQTQLGQVAGLSASEMLSDLCFPRQAQSRELGVRWEKGCSRAGHHACRGQVLAGPSGLGHEGTQVRCWGQALHRPKALEPDHLLQALPASPSWTQPPLPQRSAQPVRCGSSSPCHDPPRSKALRLLP